MVLSRGEVRTLLAKVGVLPEQARRVVEHVFVRSATTGENTNGLVRRILATLRRGSVDDGGLKREMNNARDGTIHEVVDKICNNSFAYCSSAHKAPAARLNRKPVAVV
jgi:hypothetical protein